MIATLTIPMPGTVYFKEMKAEMVEKKATSLHLQLEGDRAYGPKINFAPYVGKSIDVETARKDCYHIMPISQETWDHWVNTLPNKARWKSIFSKEQNYKIRNMKGYKAKQQLAGEFWLMKSEYERVMIHVEDIVHDNIMSRDPARNWKNQPMKPGVDYQIIMN